MIPFFDLKSYNAKFHEAFKIKFDAFLNSGWYIMGDGLKQFEHEYAHYCGTKHCLGVANGLDALRLILEGYKALGKLSSGDEIIVPANTYIATILGIIQADLVPVFVEPDPNTLNLDVEKIAAAITWKTRGIMAVHLYGRLADMKAIHAISKEKGLLVFEDAAQAHGATDDQGNKAGALSDAAGFSFYPTKNLGALGDAGAITTNDDELFAMLEKLRNYGTASKYISDHVGWNSRLDEIQALFLSVKLQALDRDNAHRIALAKTYNQGLQNDGFIKPEFIASGAHVYHQYVLRTRKRSEFIDYMKQHGIGTLVHYPVAPHQQKALKSYNYLKLPITEAIHSEVVSLPLNPGLQTDAIEEVINVVNSF